MSRLLIADTLQLEIEATTLGEYLQLDDFIESEIKKRVNINNSMYLGLIYDKNKLLNQLLFLFYFKTTSDLVFFLISFNTDFNSSNKETVCSTKSC